jgi:putative hemolysin
MKRIFIITIILMAITACTGLQLETAESTAMIIPPLNMPNPASVYCEKNDYTLEIRTAPDGSQSGVCVFPDGSTCDEWAYYWEECGPAVENSPTPATTLEATTDASGGYMPPGTAEEISDWWGVINSNGSGAEYDDCFERQDLGQIIYFGIDSRDPAVQSQIVALRESGRIVHLYGILVSNMPDCNGSQIQVDRIEVED